METLEAIKTRRTARMPFDDTKVPDTDIDLLTEIAAIAPDGGPPGWRLIRVEDDSTKVELAQIVRHEFGCVLQRDARKFREVFSRYPQWLRFSSASQDGIQLVGMPRFMRYFYRAALGRTLGPWFGRMGIMSAEIKAYCRNITNNPILFGVFLEQHGARGASFMNVGGMLQNLRLAATSIGLHYQDIGWITATKKSSEKARALLGVPEGCAAVNFFRIGYARSPAKEPKRSDFRRELVNIVHVREFGRRTFQPPAPVTTYSEVIDVIRGEMGEGTANVSAAPSALGYILEAARWAPTGFNVQPFEFVISERDGGIAIVVIEDRRRRDPDPGPCEALARGGVLQNIRLAARALRTPCEVLRSTDDERLTPAAMSIPATHVIIGIGLLPKLSLLEIAATMREDLGEAVMEGRGKVRYR